MDDCTVDGSAQRNSTPSTNVRSSTCGISSTSTDPIRGNSTKVVPAMPACSFQLVMPARIASRDNRAPWRKNSAAIATTAAAWKNRALEPWQGSMVAMATVPVSAMTNTSGRSRRMPAGSMAWTSSVIRGSGTWSGGEREILSATVRNGQVR